MRQLLATLTGFGLLCAVGAFVFADDDTTEAKYSIKEVMKQAHGEKLLNKVLDGEATQEDKAKLLDLYLSLLENEPPKGEADEWHAKAGAVVIAAAKVTAGRDGSLVELKTATNCGACHKVHKGS